MRKLKEQNTQKEVMAIIMEVPFNGVSNMCKSLSDADIGSAVLLNLLRQRQVAN